MQIIPSVPSKGYAQEIVVAKSGGDFTSLKSALASISDSSQSKPYSIRIRPGVYTEDNPIPLKGYVDISACGEPFDVTVVAQNAGSNLFNSPSGGGVCGIRGLTLNGVTTAKALNFDSDGLYKIERVFFVDCQTGIEVNISSGAVYIDYCGVSTPTITMNDCIKVLSGNVFASAVKLLSTANVTRVFNVSGASSVLTISGSINMGTVGTVFYANNGGKLQVSGCISDSCSKAFHIDSSGDSVIHAHNVHIENSTFLDLDVDSATAVFRATNVDIDRDKIDVADLDNIFIAGVDRSIDAYRYLFDVHIGNDGRGNSLAVGTGGSYATGVKVLSYNGSAYVDETEESVIDFPNTSVNTALYFGNTNEEIFYGLSLIMGDTKLSGGEIVWEYYDGGVSDWVQFAISANLNTFSDSFQNSPFQQADENDIVSIRLDERIKTGITENNASATGIVSTSVNSITGKWVRCRISSGITTSMKFSSARLKGSYTSIRENGTISYHGEARAKASEGITLGDAGGTSGNASIAISTNITYAQLENRFANGAVDKSSFRFMLPDDIDTSCGLKIVVDWAHITEVSGGVKTALMHLYSAIVPQSKANSQEVLYDGNYSEQDQTLNLVTESVSSAHRTYRVESKTIDISAYDPGDVVYFSLERKSNETGDDLNSHLYVSTTYYSYRKWQEGVSYSS